MAFVMSRCIKRGGIMKTHRNMLRPVFLFFGFFLTMTATLILVTARVAPHFFNFDFLKSFLPTIVLTSVFSSIVTSLFMAKRKKLKN